MAVNSEADTSPRIPEAKKLSKTDPSKAEAIYKDILSKKPGGTVAALLEYEAALLGLGESYRDTSKWNDLAELVKSSTSQLTSFTKAKTAKLGMAQPTSFPLILLSQTNTILSPPTPRLLPLPLQHHPPPNLHHKILH